MKNLSRSTRLAVVPAVFAALALSACQDEAPSAAPPTPASPTAEASQGGGGAPEATQSEDAPTEEPSSEAPTQAPQTSEDTGGSSGGCESTDLFKIKRGSVSPKARTEAQTVKKDYGDGSAEVTIGKPEVDTSGGDSYFPGEGKQVVVFPVTLKAVSGSYVISELHFGLTDSSDQPCKRDVLNAVVPNSDEIQSTILQQGDTKSGKVGFAVPAGADLSKYSVVYAEDYSGGQADVAWKAE